MRIKRGTIKRQKHKEVLKRAKGFRLALHKNYRKAKQALLHSGQYNFAHRKKRQSQFRKIWIRRINAVCKEQGILYSRFINNLKTKGVIIDRKILSYLAYNHKFALVSLIKGTAK